MRSISTKYSTDGSRIFNVANRVDIPDDEPLFLLRGQDLHAFETLMLYRDLCAADGKPNAGKRERDLHTLHLRGIDYVIDSFTQFRNSHPERMKLPGITGHLKAEQEP